MICLLLAIPYPTREILEILVKEELYIESSLSNNSWNLPRSDVLIVNVTLKLLTLLLIILIGIISLSNNIKYNLFNISELKLSYFSVIKNKLSFFTILLTLLSSIFSLIWVPMLLLKVDPVSINTLYFCAISTHLLCRTFAPSFERSSISVYDNSSIFLASVILFGSVEYTPSTSEKM